MRIYTKHVVDMETGEVLESHFYEYDGPVALCGGTSADAAANEAAQTAFYQQMTSEENQIFQQNQQLASMIQAVAMPYVKGGPNQYGFSSAEDALLHAQIIGSGSQAMANALNSASIRDAQSGGLANSAARQAMAAEIGEVSQQQIANQLTAEKVAGYQQGNKNYLNATNMLMGEQNMLNPTQYAKAATDSGSNATNAINLADSENNEMWQNIIGGVTGGAMAAMTGGASLITSLKTPAGG